MAGYSGSRHLFPLLPVVFSVIMLVSTTSTTTETSSTTEISTTPEISTTTENSTTAGNSTFNGTATETENSTSAEALNATATWNTTESSNTTASSTSAEMFNTTEVNSTTETPTTTENVVGIRQALIDGLLDGYDARIPPNFEDDAPVNVKVQLRITNIDSISETHMDYSMGMFLRQSWYDKRLSYDPPARLQKLELDTRLMDKVWVPDLFMTNEKKAAFHLVTVPNKLMHIYPDGRIQYSLRISATLGCNMDLRKYPLDTQRCAVILESYGYSTENLVFHWNPTPVIRADDLKLPQFELGMIDTLRCDKTYVGVDYTCIMLELELHRSHGYYVIQVYIPSILIVILSWVSFWLDVEAVPARISLGLLTILTMTTQSTGARSSLPKVSYVKAIDLWMSTCLFFVFAGLLEFAYVNVLMRMEKRRKALLEAEGGTNKSNQSLDATEAPVTGPDGRVLKPLRIKARTVDRIARYMFPGTFILFNFIYWFVFIFWQPI